MTLWLGNTLVLTYFGQVDRAGPLGHDHGRVEQLVQLLQAGAGRLHHVE